MDPGAPRRQDPERDRTHMLSRHLHHHTHLGASYNLLAGPYDLYQGDAESCYHAVCNRFMVLIKSESSLSSSVSSMSWTQLHNFTILSATKI